MTDTIYNPADHPDHAYWAHPDRLVELAIDAQLDAEQNEHYVAQRRFVPRISGADDEPLADILIRPEGAYRLVVWRGKNWLQHAPIQIDGKIDPEEWVDVAWDCIDDDQKAQAAYALRQLDGAGDIEPRAAGWQG